MRKSIMYITFLLLFSSYAISQDKYMNYGLPIAKLIDSLGSQQASLSLLIDKSDFKLSILSDTIIIKEYPVVFGGNTVDDKLMEGDQRTPEGIFYMNSKYPHKSWSKFIWINYPTEESWRKHNEAKKDGLIPENASIGGEIGIHGVPKAMNKYIDIQYNWTLGCISLKNKDINELYPYITNTTIIEIRK